MSKTFKVVCINDKGMNYCIQEGKVYEAVEGDIAEFWMLTGIGQYSMCRFLQLPTEPKTCADMTMEEWLAMNAVLAGPDKKLVEFNDCGSTYSSMKTSMLRKCYSMSLYRIKPDNADAIERIEKEMRKLADKLAELKE